MHCPTCGADNLETMLRCANCGNELVNLGADPESPEERPGGPALWNPDVAAGISLLGTPVFGAVIHAINWNRLGEPRRAVVSWVWVGVLVVYFLVVWVYAALAIPNGKSADNFNAVTNILALVLWYFIAGRPQAKFVSEKLKKIYTRRSWFAPICAIIIFVGAMYKLGDLLK